MAFAVGDALISVTPPLALNTTVVAVSNALPAAHVLMVSTIHGKANKEELITILPKRCHKL